MVLLVVLMNPAKQQREVDIERSYTVGDRISYSVDQLNKGRAVTQLCKHRNKNGSKDGLYVPFSEEHLLTR